MNVCKPLTIVIKMPLVQIQMGLFSALVILDIEETVHLVKVIASFVQHTYFLIKKIPTYNNIINTFLPSPSRSGANAEKEQGHIRY